MITVKKQDYTDTVAEFANLTRRTAYSMQTADVAYEVLIGKDNRWMIESIHPAKILAMSHAQALLAANQHEAVRVTRTAGKAPEKVVFEQETAGMAEKPITISPIDEAAFCDTLADLNGFEARKTVGRVLRRYLDEHGITALEILHSYWHLQDVQRTDKLYDQAIHRIASIQARAYDLVASERIDKLYGLSKHLTEELRDIGKTAPYTDQIAKDGLAAALKAIEDAFIAERRPLFTNAVLAEFLSRERDWNRKLVLVFDQIDMGAEGDALAYLDEICAEILDGAEAIKMLLGGQPDMVSALRILARVSGGRQNSALTGAPLLNRLNAIMATNHMPMTRSILLERVTRSLSSAQPLTREDETADGAAFPALVTDLVWYAGLSGGVEISEAVTRRCRTALKTRGEDLTAVEGITRILAMLPNRAVKIGYLLDLSRSPFGERHQAAVLTTLLSVVKSVSSLSNLLPERSTRNQLALAVEDLRNRLGGDALGEEISTLIEKKLAKILNDGSQESRDIPSQKKAPGKTQPAKPARAPKPDADGKRKFLAGEAIFSEGDNGDEAYMILSGLVEISVQADGSKLVLAKLDRGEIFGEMALIDDQPRMAAARAMTDTEVVVVPQESFKKRLSWLSEEDRLISHILDALVSRLRQQPFAQ